MTRPRVTTGPAPRPVPTDELTCQRRRRSYVRLILSPSLSRLYPVTSRCTLRPGHNGSCLFGQVEL